MNKFWIIVGQVYKKNVKSMGFLSMVLSPIIILLVVAVIIYFVAQSESEIPKIAVFSDEPQVVEALTSQPHEEMTITTAYQTPQEAKADLEAEKLDGYLQLTEENGLYTGEYVYTPQSADVDIEQLTNLLSKIQLEQQTEELNLSQEAVEALLTPAQLKKTRIEFRGGGGITTTDNVEDAIKMGSAYAVGIAVFVFIMTYSSIIAEEIASEKGTRIMEVILSSVSSTVHFFGKLTGIFLICLTQIGIYAVIGLIAFQLPFVKELLAGVDVIALLKGLAGTSLVYFLFGVILYAVIAAFLGSLVTKIEDVSKAVSPIVFIALGGFYAGLFAFYSPNHLVVKVASYIPLFTPFVMPFRIASDTVSTAGILVSILVLLLFTLITTGVSAVLYRSNVLIYSDSGMFKTMKTSLKGLKKT